LWNIEVQVTISPEVFFMAWIDIRNNIETLANISHKEMNASPMATYPWIKCTKIDTRERNVTL